jgi:hypothetical protein
MSLVCFGGLSVAKRKNKSALILEKRRERRITSTLSTSFEKQRFKSEFNTIMWIVVFNNWKERIHLMLELCGY